MTNMRPSSAGPYWGRTSITELEHAQNTWDLMNETKRANDLKEMELKQNSYARDLEYENTRQSNTILDLENENRQLKETLYAQRKELDDRFQLIQTNIEMTEKFQALRESLLEHEKKYDIRIKRMIERHQGMKVTGCKTFITAETEPCKQRAIQKAKELEEKKAIEEMRKEITKEVTLEYKPLKIAVEQIYDIKSDQEAKAFKEVDATKVYNEYKQRGLYLQGVCTMLGFVFMIIGLVFGINYFMGSFLLLSSMILAFTIDAVLWCTMQGIGKAVARYYEKVGENKKNKIKADNEVGYAIKTKLDDLYYGLVGNKVMTISGKIRVDYGVIQEAINEEIEKRLKKALANIPHITNKEDSE